VAFYVACVVAQFRGSDAAAWNKSNGSGAVVTAVLPRLR